MKDWQIILAVLVGVLALRFLFRERFQDSPTGVRGPPYTDDDILKILKIDRGVTDRADVSTPEKREEVARKAAAYTPTALVKAITEYETVDKGLPPPNRPLYETQSGRATLFSYVEQEFIRKFHNLIYAPATTPITTQLVDGFLNSITMPTWVTAKNQRANVREMLVDYFVNQPAGPANVGPTVAQQQSAMHSTTSGFGYAEELASLGQNPYNATQSAFFGATGATGSSQTTSSSGELLYMDEALNKPGITSRYAENAAKVQSFKDELLKIEKRIANNSLSNVKYAFSVGPLPNNIKPIYNSWDTVLKDRIFMASNLAGKSFPNEAEVTESELMEKLNKYKNNPYLTTFPPDWFMVMENMARKMAGFALTSRMYDTVTTSSGVGLDTTTGGSTTSSWGPSGSENAGGKGFNVFGPEFAGVGAGGGGDGAYSDSTKSTPYPELIGGRLGSGKTRVDGVGMINPSVNAPGMNMNLPDFNTLGRSLMPGDQDPYRVAQTFDPSSYSSKRGDPVPFLTDFSSFFK